MQGKADTLVTAPGAGDLWLLLVFGLLIVAAAFVGAAIRDRARRRRTNAGLSSGSRSERSAVAAGYSVCDPSAMSMIRTGRDQQIVDVQDHDACLYWSSEFGVEPDQLKSAVAAVGPRADDVRDYLERNVVVPVKQNTAD